ncbi:ribonuclease P protein component [Candidatus Peregrinibacteria bacterium]|nr:ribonuclease P protein component [Candidatus Peregrinibacteria bacterium]
MIAKTHRIKREKIPYILKKGESYKTKLFIVRKMNNEEDFCRFSVIISRKISNKAVTRNKIKRRIYEAVRLKLKKFTPSKGSDIVLIPKKAILDADYSAIAEDINNIIK